MDAVEPVGALGLPVGRPKAVRGRIPRRYLAGGAIVGAAMLLPAIYLVIRASSAGAGVLDVLREPRTIGLLARTVGLAVAVTVSAVALGVPLAWLTARTDLPARRVLGVLVALPLVIPSYVGGYVFVAALGPKGIVQGWLEPLGVERLPSIYGFWGAWLALTLFTYPYVVLTARAAIVRLDPALEEASRSLGLGARSTFRRLTLPLLRPAATAGALLVALYTVHDFGAVSLLRYDTFTRAIFITYKASFDRSRAAVLGLVLVALAFVVVAAELRARGRAAYHGTRAPRPVAPSPLGRWRWPAFAACLSVVAVALAMPIGVIVYWFARSVRRGIDVGEIVASGAHSVQAGALAAVAAVALAWPVAVLAVRHRGGLARAVERVSFTGYALPGIVVALSLVFFGANATPALYQTLGMLVFAYVVLFLPQATGALRASLLQVPPSLEDAARALGSGLFRVERAVLLPLIAPGALAGGALVFLTVMKELPATLLLAPTGFSTLATDVWSATSAAFFDRAAPPALALILVSSAPLAVMMLRERAR